MPAAEKIKENLVQRGIMIFAILLARACHCAQRAGNTELLTSICSPYLRYGGPFNSGIVGLFPHCNKI